ncbi:MAG: putative selenate ABC transporter substrate-binding protein [Planctomycetes bacterium]|nr:putative selenate ABC transporter substrate-binding protein [Planctomycetota bacterium]MCB9904087.1 putative selenate ABC transporter substrate-binding protein [Planctomycetota bacterium]
MQHRITRRALAATVLGLCAFVSSCSTEDVSAGENKLVFTAIPNENTTELMQKFQPVAAYLEAQLGVPVEYKPATNYEASVEFFKNGDVQLAWFGGLTGVRARDAVSGATAIAQGVADPKYHSYFIANADTGLKPGKDFPMGIAGKTFTFGSPGSTSGRLMPEYFIRKHSKQSPAQFLAGDQMNFSGAHDATAKAVEAGTFDAGALDYKVYDRMVEEGKLDPAKCVVIWQTPDYADYNWTAHPVLEERFGAGFTKKLQTALIAMKDPALLAAVNRPEGLIAASNADFEDLRQLAIEVGLVRQ